MLSVRMFKSSVSEFVTMLDAGRVEEADEARVKCILTRPLLHSPPPPPPLSSLSAPAACIAGAAGGRGTDISSATRRASQFRSAREEGDSSGRSESRLRRMTEKPFCSHRAIGESLWPVDTRDRSQERSQESRSQ